MRKSIKDILAACTNVTLGNIDSVKSNGLPKSISVYAIAGGVLLEGSILSIKSGTEYLFTPFDNIVGHAVMFVLYKNDIGMVGDAIASIVFEDAGLCCLLVDVEKVNVK